MVNPPGNCAGAPSRLMRQITPEPPPYLERNKDDVSGRLMRLPERDEIPLPVDVDERLIVELASRSSS